MGAADQAAGLNRVFFFFFTKNRFCNFLFAMFEGGKNQYKDSVSACSFKGFKQEGQKQETFFFFFGKYFQFNRNASFSLYFCFLSSLMLFFFLI